MENLQVKLEHSHSESTPLKDCSYCHTPRCIDCIISHSPCFDSQHTFEQLREHMDVIDKNSDIMMRLQFKANKEEFLRKQRAQAIQECNRLTGQAQGYGQELIQKRYALIKEAGNGFFNQQPNAVIQRQENQNYIHQHAVRNSQEPLNLQSSHTNNQYISANPVIVKKEERDPSEESKHDGINIQQEFSNRSVSISSYLNSETSRKLGYFKLTTEEEKQACKDFGLNIKEIKLENEQEHFNIDEILMRSFIYIHKGNLLLVALEQDMNQIQKVYHLLSGENFMSANFGFIPLMSRLFILGGRNAAEILEIKDLKDVQDKDRFGLDQLVGDLCIVGVLNKIRYNYAIVDWHDKIYIIGGTDDTKVRTKLSSTEVIKLKSKDIGSKVQVSIDFPLLQSKRSGHSAMVLGSKLYVLFGVSVDRYQPDIETIDLANPQEFTIINLSKQCLSPANFEHFAVLPINGATEYLLLGGGDWGQKFRQNRRGSKYKSFYQVFGQVLTLSYEDKKEQIELKQMEFITDQPMSWYQSNMLFWNDQSNRGGSILMDDDGRFFKIDKTKGLELVFIDQVSRFIKK
ncbi:hypothetical protein FGO68_gene12060 [Halteria grandinella]|uniref:Uncharacterized protein n=1 Tax=Halteria grandinella TaxID=5974 RepID=A0A8J8T3C4_HALGN|nr:hypothetical protein FGO68_gene12060 [Halteria grandinella]